MSPISSRMEEVDVQSTMSRWKRSGGSCESLLDLDLVALVPDWNVSGARHLHHSEDWKILESPWLRLVLSGEYGLFLNK